MNEQAKRWTPTCNRFVAFMDIMGFKDMVVRNNHHIILGRMKRFRKNVIDALEQEAQRRMGSTVQPMNKPRVQFGKSVVKPVLFSDSILLVSNDDTRESAEYMIFAVRRLLKDSLAEGIPIKGAIAYGEQTAEFESSLHFGRPLIDAFELQNELQLYGVILHHTLEQFLSEKKLLSDFKKSCHIYNYPAPLTNGTVNHYVVGWPDEHPNNNFSLADISRLYNSVSGSPRRYVDNTMAFVNWLNKKGKGQA